MLDAADFIGTADRWEAQLQRVVKAMGAAARSTQAALPPGSRMPFARNPLFVGREDELKALAAALKTGATAAISQVAAATGMGGIGKSNLATEFVHRYGQFFAGGIFWLSFAEPAHVPAEVAACGGPAGLDLPGFDALTQDDQIVRVRQEWQRPIPACSCSTTVRMRRCSRRSDQSAAPPVCCSPAGASAGAARSA